MVATSCTRNNGDIDLWFGTWHVESIEKDGVVIDGYNGTNFFQFQTTIFQLRYTDELHNEMQTTGCWIGEDTGITIWFPDEKQVWVQLYGIDMNKDIKNHFKIELHKGKDLVLSLVSSDGHTYRYYLKKWG